MPNPLQDQGPSPVPFSAPDLNTVSVTDISAQTPPVQNQTPTQIPTQTPPKNGKKNLILAIVVLLAIAASAVAILFIYPKFIKQKIQFPSMQTSPQENAKPSPSATTQSTKSAQVQTENPRFDNVDFSIVGPTGWPKIVGGKDALVLFQNKTADTDANGQTFGASINVTTEFTSEIRSLDEYSKKTNVQRQNTLIGYKPLSQTKGMLGTQAANVDVYLIKIGNIDVKQGQIYTIKNHKAYVITFNAQAASWDKYAQVFNSSAQSFQFTAN